MGLALLALGWAMNAIVIAANAGMPLSLSAYRASGQTAAVTPGEGGFLKTVIARDDTRLPWLGDIIPLKPIHRVVSAGDLGIVVGLAFVVSSAVRGSSSVHDPRRGRDSAARTARVRPLLASARRMKM